MTLPIALLLLILLVALVMFALEWFSADVVALAVMLSLVLLGMVTPAQAFAGFGSDPVLMIFGLLVLTAALIRTGAVDLAGRLVLRHAGDSPRRLLAMVMITTCTLSAFTNNTAAAAFFLPVTMGVAARARISPSLLLMPLAFAAILPSSVTLFATSTNVVVSGLLPRYGMEPMGVFELTPVGIPIAVVGLAFMLTIGRRLVPDRGTTETTDAFGLREYLTEVVIRPGSRLVGQSLAGSGLGRDLDLRVLRVLRGDKELAAAPGLDLAEGDVLLVQASRPRILQVKDIAGIDIKADVALGETLGDPGLRRVELKLVEALVLPRSSLAGRTLASYQFRERTSLQVLGIYRHGETILDKLSQARLRVGDLLLLQGAPEHVDEVAENFRLDLQILGVIEHERPLLRHAPIAVACFLGAIVVASLELLPAPVAVLAGATAAFFTRCVSPEEAYRAIRWDALILIGSMLSVGVAMEETGTARFLAEHIVQLAGSGDPHWLLAGFFLLTLLLTQPMSNQAAAIVVLPIAVQSALQLDLNSRTFAMAIAVAASCSFITPLEPACLIVYGPGRYRFFDFMRVGLPLTLLIFGIAMVLVPLVWPLHGP